MAITNWDQEAGMAGDANIENVANLADQAEESASNALDSENAASLSATAAAGSATAANQHRVDAESAKNSAETAQGLSESARDAALGYSNTASGHATTATTQAGIATTQASTATTQAGIATTQAGIATTKAGEAATSETNASTSASAAASSATAAQTAETNAETAETNAASSASAASTSATSASNSATAAASSATSASTSATNAASSETAAATSKTNAATSETNAASSAANAATSETNAATSESNAATSEANAIAAYDNFDDRYLGSKPNDPTLDNDGDALLTGALYFNSTDDVMKVYDGASWVAAYASIAGITLDNVTTDGNTTSNSITVGGLTSTGAVILNADPSSNLGAATKQYVDTIAAAGIHYHDPVRVEQEGNLTATYDNGSSGVGATLTNSSTQEALVIDGVTLSAGDRVLIYEQTNEAQNGIYTVTDVGSGSTNWVLTRAADADSYAPSDPDSFGQGDAFYVKEGLLGAGETYVMTTEGPITFGTTNIHFSQISSAQVYSGGTGIGITGTTISSTATLANVTTAGNSTTNSITVGGITSTGSVTASNLNTNDWDTAYGWGNHASAGYYVNGTVGFASTGIDDNATSTAITIDSIQNVGIAGSLDLIGGRLDLSDDASPNLPVSIQNTGTYGSQTSFASALSASGQIQYSAADHLIADNSTVAGGYPNSWLRVNNGLTFGFGSSTAVTIDSSENVGIGTSSPDSKFVVSNGAAASGVEFIPATGSTSLVSIERSSNAFEPFRYRALDHRFETGASQSEAVRIDSSGNVGIGTSSPDSRAKLAVVGSNSALEVWADSGLANATKLVTYDRNGAVYRSMHYDALDHVVEVSGTERMRIESDGIVKIGGTGQGALKLEGPSTGTEGGQLDIECASGLGTYSIDTYSDDLRFLMTPTAGKYQWYCNSNSTIGMTLDASGNLTAAGNVTAYSDERLKDNIETLDGSKVYEMRGVSFTKDGETGSGVIAQELQKVAPELVHEGEEYLSVAYGNLVGYLIEAVKELKAEIDELKGAK